CVIAIQFLVQVEQQFILERDRRECDRWKRHGNRERRRRGTRGPRRLRKELGQFEQHEHQHERGTRRRRWQLEPEARPATKPNSNGRSGYSKWQWSRKWQQLRQHSR